MPNIAELEAALVKADAAGNADDARRLAKAIKQQHWQVVPETVSVPKAADLGRLHQFGTGAAEGFMRLGSGLRAVLPEGAADALNLATPESVAAISAYNKGSNWSTGGRAATDIATSLLPVGAATNVAGKVLPHAAPLIGDVIGSAAHGALTADEGQRTAGAGLGVIGAGLGNIAGKALGRAVVPAGQVSKEAQLLMDQGVPLTPGQVGGGAMETAEGFMGKIPGVGGMVRRRQEDAQKATATALAKALNVPNVSLADTAYETVQSLKLAKNQAYNDAFKAAAPDVAQKFTHNIQDTQQQLAQLRGVDIGDTRDVLRNIKLGTDQIKKAASAEDAARIWKDVDSILGEKGARFAPIQAQWRKDYFAVAGPTAAEKTLQGDLTNRFTLGLEKAVGNRTDATPDQFVRALRSKNIDPQTVIRDAEKYVDTATATRLGIQANRVNELAESASRVVKKNVSPWTAGQGIAALGAGAYGIGAGPAGIAAALGAGTTASLYSKPGVKYATGQAFKNQQALAQSLRQGKVNQLLRRAGATQLAATNERTPNATE